MKLITINRLGLSTSKLAQIFRVKNRHWEQWTSTNHNCFCGSHATKHRPRNRTHSNQSQKSEAFSHDTLSKNRRWSLELKIGPVCVQPYAWITCPISKENHKSILQSFPMTIEQCLTKRFVLRDRLQYLTVAGDITNRPLAQACATQPEHVAGCTQIYI